MMLYQNYGVKLTRWTFLNNKMLRHAACLGSCYKHPHVIKPFGFHRSYSRTVNIKTKNSFRSNVEHFQRLCTGSNILCRHDHPQRQAYLQIGTSKGRNGNSDYSDHSRLFAPVHVEGNKEVDSVGVEIAGPISKRNLSMTLNKFFINREVKELAADNGITDKLLQQVCISFRNFCETSKSLPTDLHVIITDIIRGNGHIHDIFPYFLRHAWKVYPHLKCLDDLRKISDLTQPVNWYPMARTLNRKIVFHAGPTNSGKTYHALERFLAAKSGIYCGPLKLLAVEIFNKSNARGTPCDLVTGEERRYAASPDEPASHVSCSVEMASLTANFDVAVIDEIQMIRDGNRGWAWTRALLGLCAKEVHVCGEGAAIDIIQELVFSLGEELEIRRYKRLTNLVVEDSALQSLENVQPGDAVVCFNKNHIHEVTKKVESYGHEVAVIYGGLPPGTKLSQTQKFNDPAHPCKVLVATDAIGMGLNLSIRRIVFYSLIKPVVNEKGEMEMNTISTSTALQIAGRAGRYGTRHETGYVTTLKTADLPTLRLLLSSIPEDIHQAGLHPTIEQVELFAYHLPDYTLSDLINIFTGICTVDLSLYFMCSMEDFKFFADMIQHVPLDLKSRYIFCCSPINRKSSFLCAMFVKFARQFSQGECATVSWLCELLNWPFTTPQTLADLLHLEAVFDTFDLYLWLSYRFPDMFPDGDFVRNIQKDLDKLIEEGVINFTSLAEKTVVSKAVTDVGEQSPVKAKASRLKRKDEQSEREEFGHGRITSTLMAKGVISPEMLKLLRKEWQMQEMLHQVREGDLLSDESDEADNRSKRNEQKRKPKYKQ